MKKAFYLTLLLLPLLSAAQTAPPIVPEPAQINRLNGRFILDSSSIIHTPPSLRREAGIFAEYVLQYYHVPINVTEIIPGTRNMPLTNHSILLDLKPVQNIPSSYSLVATENGCTISGDADGIFYGLQTLQQLLPVAPPSGHSIPVQSVEINDHPRFRYRGMHLDVGRHMFPVSYIKRYIDYLAWHKFNYFHWHLTEDQGWRIEIKRYPELTKTGSCRKQTLKGRYGSDQYDGTPYCGFYTQEEVKDIIRYASDRHISIIPEIDMPGHSKAALSSYPFLGCTKGPYEVMQTWGVAEDVLCAGNDSTMTFMQNVLSEIIDLFPAPYIHIGGDECPKTRWKKCPVCQARIRSQNLTDEHGLQSDFIRRIELFVNGRGKTIIGWDEILEGGLAPNAIVMSWRGETGGIKAANMNHQAIMTPENPLYLNHAQSKYEDSITQGGYNPIESVYRYDPVPSVLDSQHAGLIWGAQGNMWSEYINNTSKLEYMLFPRISALSEVLWSPREKRDWPAFEAKLPGLLDRYRLWKTNFSTAYFDLQPTVVPGKNGRPAWKLETKWPASQIMYVTDSSNRKLIRYGGAITIDRSGTYGAMVTDKHKRIAPRWIWQSFNCNKATGKKISLASEPNKSYSMGGAFTLVDAVQNSLGMVRSSQFLGFNGRDMEAVIDLGKKTRLKEIILHAFEQTGSWIYRPKEVIFLHSPDGRIFTPFTEFITITGSKNLQYRLQVATKTRFIKIIARNPGMIADGLPGAGHNAWIFFDEIEAR